jgi:hypothetical protein
MKKFVLLAAAGLLTTATIVYASVAGNSKPALVKAGAKKEVKKTKCSGAAKKSMCSGYYTRTT